MDVLWKLPPCVCIFGVTESVLILCLTHRQSQSVAQGETVERFAAIKIALSISWKLPETHWKSISSSPSPFLLCLQLLPSPTSWDLIASSSYMLFALFRLKLESFRMLSLSQPPKPGFVEPFSVIPGQFSVFTSWIIPIAILTSLPLRKSCHIPIQLHLLLLHKHHHPSPFAFANWLPAKVVWLMKWTMLWCDVLNGIQKSGPSLFTTIGQSM